MRTEKIEIEFPSYWIRRFRDRGALSGNSVDVVIGCYAMAGFLFFEDHPGVAADAFHAAAVELFECFLSEMTDRADG